MQKLIANANQVLAEKEMQDVYFIKEVNYFKLPIMEHHVTIYFEAREKYSIFEYQLLQFIAVTENKMIIKEVVEDLIGLQEGSFTDMLNLLEKDGVVQTDEQMIQITERGETSVLDGYSPIRKLQRNVTFHYEPATSFFVENINSHTHSLEPLHPIYTADGFDKKRCPLVNEEQILLLYKKITNEPLLESKKDYKFLELEHHVVACDNSLVIQGMELFNKEGNETVQAIWNSENKQFIRLA